MSSLPLLLLILTIINISINQVSCDVNDKQVVVFMVDGLLSRMSTGTYMPLLHTFVDHGIWDMHMRGDVSYSDDKIGWISTLYGVTPAEIGCDTMAGCGALAPEITDPYNFFDVLTDTLGYQDNIHSEDPLHTTEIIGDVYNIHPFTSRVNPGHDITDDLMLSAEGDRLVVVHWNQLVTTGFSDGWASSNYIGQVACLDYQIHKLTMDLWAYSPNRTTFILLSDRGGYHFSNQNFRLDTAQIVFSAWGYGVKQPPNINHIAINPTQLPKTFLAMVDDDFELDAPDYWNADIVEECLQSDSDLNLDLDAVDTPTNPFPPLCIIPNSVRNDTLKVVLVCMYSLMFLLAYQLLKVRSLLFV